MVRWVAAAVVKASAEEKNVFQKAAAGLAAAGVAAALSVCVCSAISSSGPVPCCTTPQPSVVHFRFDCQVTPLAFRSRPVPS